MFKIKHFSYCIRLSSDYSPTLSILEIVTIKNQITSIPRQLNSDYFPIHELVYNQMDKALGGSQSTSMTIGFKNKNWP